MRKKNLNGLNDGDDSDISERLRNVETKLPKARFGTGRGGGDDGGMDRIEGLERSVKRLEDDFGVVKTDLTGMRGDVSEIRIALAELNSKLSIDEIRANVEKAHTDIYKWVATIVLPAATLAIAIYAGLKATAPPPASAPTVQYILPAPAS